MDLFKKFFFGLKKTQTKLSTEIRRIVTRSPKLTEDDIEELEAALLSTDMGFAVTERVVEAVRETYESSGGQGGSVLEVAQAEVEACLGGDPGRLAKRNGLTVVSLVGVNGSGKTTTAAKLAHRVQSDGRSPMLAACDTFRAAAIEQLKLWGERLDIPVVSSSYGADPASIAHDAANSAIGRGSDYLFIDTAGRLHTRQNLMEELKKVNRVIQRFDPTAPHQVLLTLDATTGLNGLSQASAFKDAVGLTGIFLAKLDGTARGGITLAIKHELDVPIVFMGTGESLQDIAPFDANDFVNALLDPPD